MFYNDKCFLVSIEKFNLFLQSFLTPLHLAAPKKCPFFKTKKIFGSVEIQQLRANSDHKIGK